MILMATNVGKIGFFESDTGKLHGIANDFVSNEEVTTMNMIEKCPFIIYCTSSGKIVLMSVPPLFHKFQKVYLITNLDHEVLGQIIGISNSIFNPENSWFYYSDDKGFIKCLDLSKIFNAIKEHYTTKPEDEIISIKPSEN